MKKTLLFSTILIGLALTGCNKSTRTSTTPTDTASTTPTTAPTTDTTAATPTDTAAARVDAAARDTASDIRRGADRAGDAMRDAARDTSNAIANAGDKLSAKYTEWKLGTSDIQADLAAKRPIVRTKENAGTPTGTMDKSTLQSAVEGRIKADSELSNLKLDVNADRKGEIQLEGKAQNAEQVARAMALALDTDGVVKVTSKIRLDDNAVKRP